MDYLLTKSARMRAVEEEYYKCCVHKLIDNGQTNRQTEGQTMVGIERLCHKGPNGNETYQPRPILYTNGSSLIISKYKPCANYTINYMIDFQLRFGNILTVFPFRHVRILKLST